DSTGPGDKEPPSEELTHSWSARFGDANEQAGSDVAVDPSGNTVITGTFWDTVDFGGGALLYGGRTDIFVAKFGSGGAHLWSKSFGDGELQEVAYVAVDASGNVIVTGRFYGSMDFGGGELTSVGSTDIFVAKFSPDGTHQWSKRFGDTGPQLGCFAATDASGNILIAGRFAGTVDFGGGPFSSGGNEDIFVAKLTPDGMHLWSKRFGDTSAQYANAITVDASGNVTIAGYLEGSVDFGGGALTNVGSIDIFVAQFDAAGDHMWSKRFGDSDAEWAVDIACDASGNVIMAGHFESTVNFGGGTLTSAGQTDGYVVKFSSTGTHLWSKRFGDADEQVANCVTADASGNVILGGNFAGTVNCGGDELTSAGSFDIYITKFTSTGTHLWSESFGDASGQGIAGVAAGSMGVIFVTGALEGTVDFGGGALTSAGSTDIFVAKFEP
ncbi:MAG: nucleotide-binding protein, partial [candidate division WOR-3 bacterium]